MRKPLKKFSDFTQGLLPHETSYLLSVEELKDPERKTILERVHENTTRVKAHIPFDISIDKRKYNHLQNWIEKKLQDIDVDQQYEWIHKMEQAIVTDQILPDQEREILRALKSYNQPWYFFTALYDMVQHYAHFLLIRLRYKDHSVVNDFLNKMAPTYLRAKDISNRIHQATEDVVGQYAGKGTESDQWAKWLSEIFYDESVDGHNRYMALVNLVFISHNYKKYDLVNKKFEYLDMSFKKGQYYSKRLLLNYYNNRLMMHSHFKQYKEAIYYGYLATRYPIQDQLLYVNNLCAVLMRTERHEEALSLMVSKMPFAQQTKNMHDRIGFVAFYMKALINNDKILGAESYGSSFLNAFHKEILTYRWHLFFSVYLEAMMKGKHFIKVIQTIRKYALLRKDEDYRNKKQYSPTIPVYNLFASYQEGMINRKSLSEGLENLGKQIANSESPESVIHDVASWCGVDFKSVNQ
jgi:hypothetical protein